MQIFWNISISKECDKIKWKFYKISTVESEKQKQIFEIPTTAILLKSRRNIFKYQQLTKLNGNIVKVKYCLISLNIVVVNILKCQKPCLTKLKANI